MAQTAKESSAVVPGFVDLTPWGENNNNLFK